MASFDTSITESRVIGKLLNGAIIPRPIAFVISMSPSGIINASPFSYFNAISSNPPLLMISVNRKNGLMKDTARNILATKQFVVHIVDPTIINQVNETSASLPYGDSELDRSTLTLRDSEIVAVPSIKEAKVTFEVQFEDHQVYGNENNTGTDLFIGRVVNIVIDDELIDENHYVDFEKLNPVGRLSGTNYTVLGEHFSLERPK
jgi:flavin reductase (DIM6/NTAB) family NADH-FMN oxidoreductase RutF